jgi:hypothetical protein
MKIQINPPHPPPKKKRMMTVLPLQKLTNDGKPSRCRNTITLISNKLHILIIYRFKSLIFATNHYEEVTLDSSVLCATQPWLLSTIELLASLALGGTWFVFIYIT